MSPLNFHFVAQISVERLLNGVAEGMVIALFAWLLLRVIGRRNSGTRFAVWFCALLAIAVAPFVESSGRPVLHPAAAVTMPRAWSSYLFAAWAGIALVGLARVVAGLWHLRSIRKSCTPVVVTRFPHANLPAAEVLALDPAVVQSIEESERRIQLCVTDELRVPTAIGLLRPTVVIPSWALRELSQAELNAVVLHEVAHLRRWDDWTNLMQKVLRALFFFHPAVWWVENRLSLEREMACDDMVLSQTANPRAYAKCLVSLAEKNLLRRGIALAQAAVGRMHHTSLRILQILDARRSNSAVIWKPAPWVIASFSVACLATAAHAPRLVAFGDPVTVPASSTVASSTPASSGIDTSFMTHVVPASYIAGTSGNEVEYHNNKVASNPERRSAVRFTIAKRALPHVQNAGFKSNRAVPSAISAVHRDTAQPPDAAPVVRTSATSDYPVVMMQQAVFIVMQDQSSGAVVPVLWRVNVWRLLVLPPVPQQVPPEISSKSI